MNKDNYELFPYQKQFLQMLESQKVFNMPVHKCVIAPRTTKMDQFDAATNAGWKLDLITGIYYKP